MADGNDSEDEPLVARLPPSKRAKPDPGSHGKSPESQEVAAKVSSKMPPADSDSEDEPLAARVPPSERAASAAAAMEAAGDAAPAMDEDEYDGQRDSVAMSVTMARAVLARGQIGDHEGVLSVLGTQITRDSPYEDQRRAYRGLARLLHPDKLARHNFKDATKAFQCLARAFEVRSRMCRLPTTPRRAPSVAPPRMAGPLGPRHLRRQGDRRPRRPLERRLLQDSRALPSLRGALGHRAVGPAAVRVHVHDAGAAHVQLLRLPLQLWLHDRHP